MNKRLILDDLMKCKCRKSATSTEPTVYRAISWYQWRSRTPLQPRPADGRTCDRGMAFTKLMRVRSIFIL